mgnify:CR=1 FL=1
MVSNGTEANCVKRGVAESIATLYPDTFLAHDLSPDFALPEGGGGKRLTRELFYLAQILHQ